MIDRDPDLEDIRRAFLKYVESFHSQHGYTRDPKALAKSLGIRVCEGSNNQAITHPTTGERLILIDETVAPNRFKFTIWHELSHHLFDMAQSDDFEEGELAIYLRDCTFGNLETRQKIEDDFCDQAAATLLIPTPILIEVKNKHGYSPLAVLELMECTGASAQAALTRLIYSDNTNVHGLVIDKTGRVIYSIAHGEKRKKYQVVSGFKLESSHPLITGKYQPRVEERFEAPVPFKGGQRTWNSKVVAAANYNCNRIVALFLDSYPHKSSEEAMQLSLF